MLRSIEEFRKALRLHLKVKDISVSVPDQRLCILKGGKRWKSKRQTTDAALHPASAANLFKHSNRCDKDLYTNLIHQIFGLFDIFIFGGKTAQVDQFSEANAKETFKTSLFKVLYCWEDQVDTFPIHFFSWQPLVSFCVF